MIENLTVGYMTSALDVRTIVTCITLTILTFICLLAVEVVVEDIFGEQ